MAGGRSAKCELWRKGQAQRLGGLGDPEPQQILGTHVELPDLGSTSVRLEPALEVTHGFDAPGRVHRGCQLYDVEALRGCGVNAAAL